MTDDQQTSSLSGISEITPFLLAEYNALREEILKRIELQYQVLSLTVVVLGTVLGFGLQAHSASIVLLYPILATFLAATWSHNGLDIKEIGTYIREQIESKVTKDNIGWEHRIRSRRRRLGGLKFLSARGIFIGTSLLAILVAVPLAHFDLIEILLFALAVISAVCSSVLLRRSP